MDEAVLNGQTSRETLANHALNCFYMTMSESSVPVVQTILRMLFRIRHRLALHLVCYEVVVINETFLGSESDLHILVDQPISNSRRVLEHETLPKL